MKLGRRADSYRLTINESKPVKFLYRELSIETTVEIAVNHRRSLVKDRVVTNERVNTEYRY